MSETYKLLSRAGQMKKIIAAIVVLVSSNLALAGSAKEETALNTFLLTDGMGASGIFGRKSEYADEKKIILEKVQKYTRSVNEGDRHPELVDELWEHSSEVSNINIRGHQKGFEDIKKNFYMPLFSALKYRNLRVVTGQFEPAVYVFDKTAIVEFYWKLNAILKDGNKAVNAAGRETHVYRKESGGWKLVHVHYSGMPVSGF